MSRAPKPRPCGSCPYRKDVPSGVWHPEEYARLPNYDKPLPEQPPALFECHQQDGHLCGGWVGTHDMDENLAVRVAAIQGRLSPEDLDAILDFQTPVELFESGTAAAAHGLAEVSDPSPRANRIQDRLLKKGIVHR